MTAFTPNRGYPYPDDYQAPADGPAAFDALAKALDSDVAGRVVDIAGQDARNDSQDAAIAAVGGRVDTVEARSVLAGAGLTGGGTLAATRTIGVGAGPGVSVAEDSVAVDRATVDTWYQARDLNTAKLMAGGQTSVGSKAIGCYLWDIGTLGAGEERTKQVPVAAGSYVFVSVQHFSTYIYAVCNLVSATVAELKVRNSTTQTTHTNVKVHLLVVNP